MSRSGKSGSKNGWVVIIYINPLRWDHVLWLGSKWQIPNCVVLRTSRRTTSGAEICWERYVQLTVGGLAGTVSPLPQCDGSLSIYKEVESIVGLVPQTEQSIRDWKRVVWNKAFIMSIIKRRPLRTAKWRYKSSIWLDYFSPLGLKNRLTLTRRFLTNHFNNLHRL